MKASLFCMEIKMGGKSMLCKIFCFISGRIIGVIVTSLCVAAGRTDEESGAK